MLDRNFRAMAPLVQKETTPVATPAVRPGRRESAAAERAEQIESQLIQSERVLFNQAFEGVKPPFRSTYLGNLQRDRPYIIGSDQLSNSLGVEPQHFYVQRGESGTSVARCSKARTEVDGRSIANEHGWVKIDDAIIIEAGEQPDGSTLLYDQSRERFIVLDPALAATYHKYANEIKALGMDPQIAQILIHNRLNKTMLLGLRMNSLYNDPNEMLDLETLNLRATEREFRGVIRPAVYPGKFTGLVRRDLIDQAVGSNYQFNSDLQLFQISMDGSNECRISRATPFGHVDSTKIEVDGVPVGNQKLEDGTLIKVTVPTKEDQYYIVVLAPEPSRSPHLVRVPYGAQEQVKLLESVIRDLRDILTPIRTASLLQRQHKQMKMFADALRERVYRFSPAN